MNKMIYFCLCMRESLLFNCEPYGLSYMWVGPGSIPFGFLEEIHQRFVRSYGRAIHSAQAYSMNDEFSRVLSQQMEYYSNDPNADRVSRIKVEMSQV